MASGNKHCFDCNQRGPTYINMTIGSFVCTKCSGMLRGLTPPHRVKSISMATFTPEEVEIIKSRGNNYCRQTWLGLYEQKLSTGTKDEQEIKDFMIDKYEKKRYYLESPPEFRNGIISQPPTTQKPVTQEVKPLKSILTNSQASKDLQIKNNLNAKTNGTMDNGVDFVADFSTADIFSAPQFNNNNNSNGTQPQASFANFDNNPIFNASNVPMSSTFTTMTNSVPVALKTPAPPPSEDKYAALKDLDNALKQQQENHNEWNTSSSNGSGYTSSPQSGSLYGSPSTGSMYGSPSQGHFISAFQQDLTTNNTSNPFQRASNVQSPWGPPNGNATVIANNLQGFSANPFRTDSFNGVTKYNGITNGFNGNQMTTQPMQQNIFSSQQINFPNTKPWNPPNPFTHGVTPGNGGHSSNPFL